MKHAILAALILLSAPMVVAAQESEPPQPPEIPQELLDNVAEALERVQEKLVEVKSLINRTFGKIIKIIDDQLDNLHMLPPEVQGQAEEALEGAATAVEEVQAQVNQAINGIMDAIGQALDNIR